MTRIAAVHPYFKRSKRTMRQHAIAAANNGEVPFDLPTLCKAYSFPTGLTSSGVIGIVELGGGWVQSDIDEFFQSIGQASPTITDVSVDGTTNQGANGGDASVEVALDIEVAGGVFGYCTGKPATIRIYWGQDIGQCVEAAAKDGCSTISISWGADEAEWGTTEVQAMQTCAANAVSAGSSVFAAAGDNDSSDGGSTPANVDCPASCPGIIGCGGTTKTATSEVVWNNGDGEGTGGGFSTVFPVQSFQLGTPTAPPGLGRMVPDVTGNADPNTGYLIVQGGQQQVVGGTSAVAPLYAGLFAAIGKQSTLNPVLWKNQSDFTDITSGNNGTYSALIGPDACSGIGAPIGTSLAATFGAAPGPNPAPPAPPPPAPPSGGPTMAQVEAAVDAAFAGHVILFKSQATSLANAAIAKLFAGSSARGKKP